MAWLGTAHLLAVDVGWDDLGLVAIISLILSGIASLTLNRRKQELIDLYKGLYEAKEKENEDLKQQKDNEIARLKDEVKDLRSRVDLYQSDFTRQLAEGVTEAIVRIFEERVGVEFIAKGDKQ